ncbi:MAG: glycosyltransferase family 4 protein [Chloroflexi bacterium]|nr:glycosyltransferase family 4 protein [Chloroflexota bacterium]
MKRLAVLESGSGIGGAEMNLLRLAPALKARGWEAVVLVPAEGTLTRELAGHGIEWRRYASPRLKSTSRYWGRRVVPDPLAIVYDVAVVLVQTFAIARVLKRERVAVVHTNSMLSHLSGGLAAKLARVPCVWHLQDIVAPRSGFGLFLPVLNLAAQAVATRVICISGAVARQLSRAGVQDKIRVIYNGIDTQEFTPKGERPFRDGWSGGNGEMVVGQVGRLTPWKGQELLLGVASRAEKENLPVRFVLIGEDGFGLAGYGDKLRGLVKQLGLGDRVVFAGWLKDMPGAMRSLDLLVHPSLDPEPFGLAVAEAMACGKPVVVADHGGASEVVGSDGCGVLFPPGNADACFDAVKSASENRSAFREMGMKARRRVEANFEFERFADQVADVYDSVAAGRRTD